MTSALSKQIIDQKQKPRNVIGCHGKKKKTEVKDLLCIETDYFVVLFVSDMSLPLDPHFICSKCID